MDNPDTIRRKYYSLERIKDNFPKYVVTMDEYRYPSKSGIVHLQAWDFCKELHKLEF